jgi:transposase InsO family protein
VCADFTYIKYGEKFIYLATIVDMYTREIVGWNISRFHSKDLVIGALNDAIKRTGHTPLYLHSDQGSEYDSQEYKDTAVKLEITLSMSRKASPWQNGYQESFFGRFKTEFGDVRNYDSLPELVEAIHHHIIYYNTERIHTSLKTTPETFKQNYYYSLQKMKGMIV